MESLQDAPTDAMSREHRLDTLEAMSAQVTDAIGMLVDAVVELQKPVEAKGPRAIESTLADLAARIEQLENQRSIQSACIDLARTSRFHPKRPSVVFVGTTYFGCNVKYAWLGFRDRAVADDVENWFLPQTREQEEAVIALGGRCFPSSAQDWQPEHITAALSAAVVVTCDHLLNPNPYAVAMLQGARHVQLWHGISIKEIGLRNLSPMRSMSPQFAQVLATCGEYSRLIGTAAAQEVEFRRWFGFERYEPIGYPRNDVLLRDLTTADLLGCDVSAMEYAIEARKAGRRVVLYAPTFRDARPGRWLVDAGLDELAHSMEQRGDTLIVALHPVEAPLIRALQASAPAARFVLPRTDLYPLMRAVDVLVTDYSSIMFDFLLLDRPVVLFRPDHEDYTTRSRKLYDTKLMQSRPGPVVTDVNGLLEVLASPDAGDARHRALRAELRRTLFDRVDARASDRLNDILAEEISRALTGCERAGRSHKVAQTALSM
jgi:CDP-glycerol glycerophosphotransferase